MEPMLPPRTRTPNPLKKGLKKLAKLINKIESFSIRQLLYASTVMVVAFMIGFLVSNKTVGIIPITIVITLFIIIIFIVGFIFMLKRKSKLNEVKKEFDATTIIWSCLTGLLTTYIGFSVSLYTSELIKKEEDKEKVAALLDLYVAKYEHEKQEVNHTYIVYSSKIGSPIIELIDAMTRLSMGTKKLAETITPNNQEDPQSVIGKDNSDNSGEVIKIKEPFISFISQNIDLYSKLSPQLQECIQNWELVNDKYNIDLINDGYPMESENPDISEKLLDQKRAEYLIIMAEVNNEISKRSKILEVEQQYLRGEISEEVHDNSITFWLSFYTEVNSNLIRNKTTKDYEQYLENYDKTESDISDEIRRKIEKEEEIVYTY
ncbi:hypothetical protein L8956_04145 [Peribacillus frigoritolerans]|uniref:hypothetical protein n=1 Tax=Peribacillus frigoritolerans TaxID=450367 RepID=UPI001EFD995C|nr:hypothetical protein [Peribacillus frigoritolerans]ULM97929.1 hypothetical protein L8956_04145 [Peribacillus frigoritolerans]